MTVRSFASQPLRGPWHLAPNPYSARYIPGTNRLYERARLGCLPGDAGHGGRDIDADSADLTLRAVWDGTIHRYAWDDFGNHIGLVNSDGIEAFYAHLATVHVSNGQAVKAGQDLGIMGETGNAYGVHCHFEIRTKATEWCTAIDPTNWLLAPIVPGDVEAEMYIFRKTSVAQLYVWFNDYIRPVTPVAANAIGAKIHTLPDDHWMFGLPQKIPTSIVG